MSLTTEKGKNTEPIAYLYPDKQEIYRINDDTDVDFNTGKVNTKKKSGSSKLKTMDKGQSFFPAVHDWSDDNMNERVYVTGKAGSGKSYHFIRPYIVQYHKKFPKNNVYLFSSKLEDKALDDLTYIQRVQIDSDMLENPVDIRQLKNSLLIFDDVEDFPNKKITKEVARLLDEVLKNGRSYNLYVVYTHHQPTDYKATRLLLFESTAIVIFPKSKVGGKHDYDYMLDKYVHLSDINKNIIKNADSKFVYITKTNPNIIISDKYILTE